jgi:anti-anti-sigma factor
MGASAGATTRKGTRFAVSALEITPSARGGFFILALSGSLDARTSGELEEAIEKLVANRTRDLVIDCGCLDYCSSAGLRVFLLAAKKLDAIGSRCAFAALTAPVAEMFELAGLRHVLWVFPDLESACSQE